MKNTYSVSYGKTDRREIEDFTTKGRAMKFAIKMVDANEETVILDEYDEDGDLINYYSIKSVRNNP